jgi:hypothetical protein
LPRQEVRVLFLENDGQPTVHLVGGENGLPAAGLLGLAVEGRHPALHSPAGGFQFARRFLQGRRVEGLGLLHCLHRVGAEQGGDDGEHAKRGQCVLEASRHPDAFAAWVKGGEKS